MSTTVPGGAPDSSEIRFALVDVFAERPLSGNPLAVVPDADTLSDEQMRAIAAEFNLSETTFLLHPTLPGADWQLRSYTPAGVEVGGAGHNALGAWLWLAITGRLPAAAGAFTQQIGGGLLAVSVCRGSSATGRSDPIEVTMDQARPAFGATFPDAQTLAEALGVPVNGLAVERLPQVVSTGVGHLLIEARDRHAVDSARPDPGRLAAVLRQAGGEGAYLYSRDPLEPERGSVAYARFFNPTVGISEDPATGTAAGPLVAALVARGQTLDNGIGMVEQGYALGRPSRIRISVAGELVRITGGGIVVADGTLHL